ncbi:TadE/TadG family type IV pilus assembly protein [Chelativorans sp. M5D2P16]|uniref:TadE/TadG family type IV pilus assembly protein n=1 Tax=Chelativorans sp. M5D2P16 TaxID=3095678 RepID=UPI002ACA6D37|nr:TadE/TadG family type IV pilus assembly protein [Chelativorans sp. M5D2P16]MDZ5700163.1 TadE/TadG family type IV pilus assembly protein [Chelativorans sp. M5D2P16]
MTGIKNNRLFSLLRRFRSETRGIAAIEFAIAVPVLLGIYILALEFAEAIEVNKKLGRVAIQVGDLVAQQPKVTPGELDAIMSISGATLEPYRRSAPTITVTAIEVTNDSTPKAVVLWSRRYTDGVAERAEKPGAITEIPQALKTPGTFLVRSEASLGYQPIIAWSPAAKQGLHLAALDELDMLGERYYQQPRVSSIIPCGDC